MQTILASLSKNQQRELLYLLDQFPEYVATHNVTLLEGFKSKHLPAYWLMERLKPKVSRQIHEMLQSPMANPLVCVLKGRDGSDGVR